MSSEGLSVMEKSPAISRIRLSRDDHMLSVLGQSSGAATRRRSEDVLRDANHFLRALVDASPFGICVTDATGIVRLWNPAAEAVFGWSEEEVLGRHLPIVPRSSLRESRRLLDGVCSGLVVRDVEKRRRRKDDSIIDVRVSASPVCDKSGSPAGVLITYVDVTAQKVARERIEFQANALSQVRDAVIVIDKQSTVTYWNRAAARLFGISESRAQGKTLKELGLWGIAIPEDQRIEWDYPEGAGSWKGETARVGADGKTILVDFEISQMENTKGSFIGYLIVARNVTEQKKAVQALQESEERYRALVELAPDGIMVHDGDGRVVFANKAVAELMGAETPAELIGRDFMDLVHPDSRDTVRERSRLSAEKGKARPLIEEQYLRLDGTVIDVEVAAIGVQYSGEPMSLVVMRDISERKLTEDALRESEAWFRLLAENAQDVIFRYELSPAVGFSYVSPAIASIVGYTPDELCDDPNAERKIICPDDYHLIESASRASNAAQSVTLRWIHRDGHIVWIEQRSAPVFDDEGNLVAIQGIGRDVTQRRELEEQLLRAHRLETAGRIAGQVAHDFNNLLSPMVAFPDIIKEELPEGHPAVQYCDAMIEAARRMADINQDLLTMGRRGRSVQKPMDLNKLIREAVSGMMDCPETLNTNVLLDPDLFPVNGAAAQLMRVVVNLIANAREAMQDVGCLTLKTMNVDVGGSAGRYNRVHPGRYVCLSVSDTGCGIVPETLDKIFDAFFTTKNTDVRRGSGLGLSVVQAIVEDHQGYIDLESEEGKGSTFLIYLPVGGESVKPEPAAACPRGRERVLVVDDDPLQRQVTGQLLRKLGYQVEEATTGEEAVDLVREHGVDLLVLDMIMPPGIDGAETYRRVLQVRPGQKAIILSGFAESDRVEVARDLGAGAFLRKPVRKQELAQAVREVLSR